MNKIVSTKDMPYNEFFALVLDALEECTDNISSLAVVALTDNHESPYVFSSWGMNEHDMMVGAAVLQRMAFSEILCDTLGDYDEDEEYAEYDDYDYDEDNEGEDGESES